MKSESQSHVVGEKAGSKPARTNQQNDFVSDPKRFGARLRLECTLVLAGSTPVADMAAAKAASSCAESPTGQAGCECFRRKITDTIAVRRGPS